MTLLKKQITLKQFFKNYLDLNQEKNFIKLSSKDILNLNLMTYKIIFLFYEWTENPWFLILIFSSLTEFK